MTACPPTTRRQPATTSATAAIAVQISSVRAILSRRVRPMAPYAARERIRCWSAAGQAVIASSSSITTANSSAISHKAITTSSTLMPERLFHPLDVLEIQFGVSDVAPAADAGVEHGWRRSERTRHRPPGTRR